jgi:hypothetical protein
VSEADQTFVRRLGSGRETHKMEAWVDWEGIPISADSWEEITLAIESAQTFLFLINPDSVSSKVRRRETEYAAKCQQRTIPVIFRDSESEDATPDAPQP